MAGSDWAALLAAAVPYQEVGDHLLKLTLFHTNDTFSQCIISMEIDLFFAIFCFQVHHIKASITFFASLAMHQYQTYK